MCVGPDYQEMELHIKDDIEAFGKLYVINYKRLFNYMLYNTGDIESALDLTAETFFKAFKFRDSFNPARASFTSWLYGIASKEIIKYFRCKKRDSALIDAYLSFPEDVEKARLSINREELEEARRQLELCDEFIDLSVTMRKLPVKYRKILTLRLVEDISFEEIASIFHIEVEAAKSQYYRALKKLRKTLLGAPTGRASTIKGKESISDMRVLEKEVE
jgi:RNA polymerase sigma-70 factor (ECF subfamily)